MANKEFKNIEEFIEGFTRNGPARSCSDYSGYGRTWLSKSDLTITGEHISCLVQV